MLKLTTDKHEASRGLSATAELLVAYPICIRRPVRGPGWSTAVRFGVEKLECCGSNNWETVADRWIHAARGLASTELSFRPCNILRDNRRGVS